MYCQFVLLFFYFLIINAVMNYEVLMYFNWEKKNKTNKIKIIWDLSLFCLGPIKAIYNKINGRVLTFTVSQTEEYVILHLWQCYCAMHSQQQLFNSHCSHCLNASKKKFHVLFWFDNASPAAIVISLKMNLKAKFRAMNHSHNYLNAILSLSSRYNAS